MSISPGDSVIAVLHSPREKAFGILRSIDAAGVSLRSIDLSYFDDWCAAIAAGEEHLTMAENFFPMWRVERLSRDEITGELPSMRELFEQRTGLRLDEQ